MATSKPQTQLQHQQQRMPPEINLRLSQDNTDFYSAPVFDCQKQRKSTSLLPSPTTEQASMLDIKPTPDKAQRVGRDVKRASTSAVFRSASRGRAGNFRADTDGDIFMDCDDYQPFKVNPSDIPPRPSSRNLTDMELRGLAMIKHLSSEGLSKSRNASPARSAPSSEDMKEVERTRRLFLNRIDELNTLNSHLQENLDESLMVQQSMEEEHVRTRGAYEELQRQHQELREKMAKRERDYDVMSKNYLDHVRLIRATDDDHSTIMERLSHLKIAIEHLIRKAQGTRSVNLNRAAAIDHLKKSGLLAGFPVSEDKLEPFHLNLFMESAVMSKLVSCFFSNPLCCIFDYNKGFQEIYDWMYRRNSKLAIRWRQQLCVMLTQDPESKTRQENLVKSTGNDITALISKVYANSNEATKSYDICNKAFDLSLAMTALESVIAPVSIPLGTPFDEETMGVSPKSNPDGKVALVIFPAFRDKEEAFNVWPKVWCC
ncbi:hypothetical protein BG011_000130 [Mortierella polycephala]|uniref:Uncharacterized protein n=1 Tax=Mortierella polycephala TaxID=41804 RepID=A0A9P6TW10_9FUNG|nr:hypothetical protein BG011_000130 [Mortierella polycephala]